MRNVLFLIFAFLCLGVGLLIIIGAVKRWNTFYDKENEEWRIMRLPLYSLFSVFHDLDDSYFIAYHILIGAGFLFGFLFIVFRLFIFGNP